MMENFIVYEKATGRIVSAIENQDMQRVQQTLLDKFSLIKFEEVMADNLGKQKMVVAGTITARPLTAIVANKTQIAADGVDSVVISDIPNASKILVFGPVPDMWEETGSQIELAVDVPGEYRVRVECWPYQDTEVVFHAA